MKEYGDEAFIRMLQENQEEAKNKDIRQGSVFVEDQELVFREHEILKEQLWMWMPDTFAPLSRELMRIKSGPIPRRRLTSAFPTGRKRWNPGRPEKCAAIWGR